MKKIVVILAYVLSALMLCVGCAGGGGNQTPQDAKAVTMEISSAREKFAVGDDFTTVGLRVIVEYDNGNKTLARSSDYEVDSSQYKKDTEGTYTITVQLKGTTIKKTYDVSVTTRAADYKKSLKILAIGNSFSEDAMHYMYEIAKSFKIETVVVANMYIGGCSLERHQENAATNKAEYQYQKNNSGSVVRTDKKTLEFALKDEEWDIITIQQASGVSGMPDTYNDDIDYLINYVNAKKTGLAKIMWHMTWAYAANSTHSEFPNYDKNQLTMYNAIVNCVKDKIETKTQFNGVIPSGTAIQNARTSYIGDKLNADGYHLNDLGDFIAGLTWVAEITDFDFADMDEQLIPKTFVKDLEMIKEAVKNAVDKPHEVTNSTFTEAPEVPEDNREVISPALYTELDWQPTIGFWNSTDEKSFKNLVTTPTDFAGKFLSSGKRFTKEELPVGTIITIADGWQYRPDGWQTEDAKSTYRPDNVKTSKVVIDENWWNEKGFTLRAFNISKISSVAMADLVEEAKAAFKIYVPKYDLSNYVEFDWKGTLGFWNSTDATRFNDIITVDAIANKFVSSSVRFAKEQLPVGTILLIADGWQYRPDGWQKEGEKSTYRPGNVTTSKVVIDENWWNEKGFTLRAFNVSKVKATVLSELVPESKAAFKIFVPKAANA